MGVARRRALDALDPLCTHRQHAVLMLQHALGHQEWLADHGGSLAIVEIGPDDDVRDPGLILEREEDCRRGMTT